MTSCADATAGFNQTTKVSDEQTVDPSQTEFQTGRLTTIASAALSIVEAAGIAGALGGRMDERPRRAASGPGFWPHRSTHGFAVVPRCRWLGPGGSATGDRLHASFDPPSSDGSRPGELSGDPGVDKRGLFSLNFAIRSIAAVTFGAVGDALGLSNAMLIAALATFGGLPLDWWLFRHGAATKPDRVSPA